MALNRPKYILDVYKVMHRVYSKQTDFTLKWLMQEPGLKWLMAAEGKQKCG